MFTTLDQAVEHLKKFPSKKRTFIAASKSTRWMIHEAARYCGLTHRTIVDYTKPQFKFKTTIYFRDGRVVPGNEGWFHTNENIDHLEITGWVEPYVAVEVGFRTDETERMVIGDPPTNRITVSAVTTLIAPKY